jgi:chloramphenicol O-acetyltransferase
MRTFILSGLLILFSINTFSQLDREEKLKELQAQKVSFFTERLNLSAQEAKKFWPVYDDYQNRKNLIAQERKSTTAYFLKNSENISEEEVAELTDKYIGYQKQETKLLEAYTEKFREFLPEKKVLQVFILEVQFKQWLLKTHIQPRPNTR